MREDTRPETPHAKSNSDPPPSADSWRRPKRSEPNSIDALFAPSQGRGARLDWGTARGKVRTLRVRGPAGWALALLVLIGLGALFSVFFVFAVGIGTVVALGAAAVAALGLGGKMLRRRLTDTHAKELGPGHR